MTHEEALAFSQSPAGQCAARDYLSTALRLDAMIALRLAQLDELRDRAERITRVVDAQRGNGSGDRVGDLAAEIADQEAGLLEDYQTLLQRQKAIGTVIRQVPEERQRMVLEMRYLQGMPFVNISMTLHYDERQTYRLHARGLRHVAAQLALGEIEDGKEFLPSP